MKQNDLGWSEVTSDEGSSEREGHWQKTSTVNTSGIWGTECLCLKDLGNMSWHPQHQKKKKFQERNILSTILDLFRNLALILMGIFVFHHLILISILIVYQSVGMYSDQLSTPYDTLTLLP